MLEIIAMGIVLILSLFIVIKSAQIFLDNVVEIGTSLGISQVILGVTAAAIGTSLPEFGSALMASFEGHTEMGVGVVIGSNIWNIAGILGITATVTGFVKADKKSVNRDGLMAIITGIILVIFMLYGLLTNDLQIPGFASIVMIIVYIYYLRILFKNQKKENGDLESTKEEIYKEEIHENNELIEKNFKDKTELEISIEQKKKPIKIKNLLFAIIGIIGLAISCRLLVFSADSLANIFGVPAALMGLFTLSIGTSISELVVTVSSAIKGLHGLSLATVFGSLTFNILIGIGLPALFLDIPIEATSIFFDVPVMIGIIAITLFIMKINDMKLNRFSGIFLLAIYAVYAFLRTFVLA